jgi:hypothetical protein
MTVGQEFRISVDGEVFTESKGFMNEKLIKNTIEKSEIEFDGYVNVLAINKLNEPSKISITIFRCEIMQDGVTKINFQKGTIIIASRVDGKKIFEINGKRVSKEIRKAILPAIPLGYDRINDDKILGTRKRRRIGESWELKNVHAFMDVMRQDGLEVQEDGIKGQTTLADVIQVGNHKCLLLTTALEMDVSKIPLPSGVVTKRAHVVFNVSGLFPVDKSIGILQEQAKIVMTAVAEGRPKPYLPVVTLEIKTEQDIRRDYFYTK